MAGSSRKLMTVAVIALIALVGVVEAKRQAVQSQLEQLTVRLEQLQGGNTQQNQEEANQIIRKVRRLMVLDESITPTVATIVDVESLRQQNAFYDKAENGDYLLVTPDRAILYNESRNVIVDVVPVQLEAPAPAAPAPAEEAAE